METKEITAQTQTQEIKSSLDHIFHMLNTARDCLQDSYQGVVDALMRFIVAHMISSSKKEETLEPMYERMKKYPYLEANLHIFNDYPFESFKLDHESVSKNLQAWQGLGE